MQEQQVHRRVGALRLAISLALLVLAVWLFFNRQAVFDNVIVWRYQPSNEIQQLVQTSKMTPHGQFYFYASQPEINDRESFNERCTSSGEQTVVLGCYSAQRIYIFNVTDPRLQGIKEVTAAHEMLHAVYDRLSRIEKERVNTLLEAELKKVTDERIKNLIEVYERTEPGERLNEIHSIFATELSVLSAELETYYAQYFSDRKAVATLSQQYEEVFSNLKNQQDKLVNEINALADKITRDTTQYNSDISRLSLDVEAFNARANNGGYRTQESFDADRNALITRQRNLETTREAISQDIVLYNKKLKELDAINGQAEQLNRSINSNALEPAPSI